MEGRRLPANLGTATNVKPQALDACGFFFGRVNDGLLRLPHFALLFGGVTVWAPVK